MMNDIEVRCITPGPEGLRPEDEDLIHIHNSEE